MNPHETGTDNPIDFPKYTLTCGCRSEHCGFFCEWDTETRECEPAVAYGCLCAKHYAEYNARPTEIERWFLHLFSWLYA
jgi:hypothetical protein